MGVHVNNQNTNMECIGTEIVIVGVNWIKVVFSNDADKNLTIFIFLLHGGNGWGCGGVVGDQWFSVELEDRCKLFWFSKPFEVWTFLIKSSGVTVVLRMSLLMKAGVTTAI